MSSWQSCGSLTRGGFSCLLPLPMVLSPPFFSDMSSYYCLFLFLVVCPIFCQPATSQPIVRPHARFSYSTCCFSVAPKCSKRGWPTEALWPSNYCSPPPPKSPSLASNQASKFHPRTRRVEGLGLGIAGLWLAPMPDLSTFPGRGNVGYRSDQRRTSSTPALSLFSFFIEFSPCVCFHGGYQVSQWPT